MTETPGRLASLAELPQELPPPRDLWPAIAARIEAEPRGAAGHGPASDPAAPVLAGAGAPPSSRRFGYPLALAATVAALSVGIWIGRGTVPAPSVAVTAPAAAPSTTVAPANLLAAFSPDARYQRARGRLLEKSRARIAALPPETQQRVNESLKLLQRSIADIRDALGRDPANVLLQELLMNAYQDEMRVLVTVDEAGTAGREI
jgi:hypothetical protein